MRSHTRFGHLSCDVVPAHFDHEVRGHLNDNFGNRWIGCGGSIALPPCSCELTPLDFHFWGYMKILEYETPVETQDLVARIQVAAGVQHDIIRQYTKCIEVDGGHIEHLL